MSWNASSCARHTVKPNKWKYKSLEQRKVCKETGGPCKETGGSCSENPEILKGFQQGIFKGKMSEGCG